MSPDPQISGINPKCYAPYRDPRDYILSWTDDIWIGRAFGKIREHYGKNVKVHTAYAETYDLDLVIQNSVQKASAFPNAGGGFGEDVVWEQRGRNGFISSHRVLKSGTHSGFWTYGPPTGRHWVSRTVAHCLVQDGLITEEWLARDEYAVLECLGMDPAQVAAGLALKTPVTGKAFAPGQKNEAFAGRIRDAAVLGVSGKRPDRYMRECRMVQSYFDTVWNQRLFHKAGDYVHDKIACHGVRMKRTQGIDPYQMGIIDLLAAFPDAQMEIRDLVVNESPDFGLRIAAIWLLRGTYSGVPAYGAANHAPVTILGASHFELRDGKILREWRVYDEVAAMAQIIRHNPPA